MPHRFASDSPVVQDVKRVLRDHPNGLTIPQIRQELRKRGRPGVTEDDIADIITLPDFRKLPDVKIILRELESDFADDAPESEPAPPAFHEFESTLRNVPPLDDYVIFDVETNGAEDRDSDFFQLSAIRIKNGVPVAPVANWYARVDTSKMTTALKAKLHYKELDIEARIREAGTQVEAVAAFRQFTTNEHGLPLPIVAHNGTFDWKMIRKYAPDLPNPLIDSLEIACLAFPALSSHSLERLAEEFKFVARSKGERVGGERWSQVEQLDAGLEISKQLGLPLVQSFHHALFDCLILYLVLNECREKLRQAKPGFLAQLRRLSPGLADWIGISTDSMTAVPARLDDLISLRDWNTEVESRRRETVPALVFDEPTVLRVYEEMLNGLQWEPREAQREMVRHTTRALGESRALMIEAPTGTGKTLAYALPAVVRAKATGERVFLSTSTKNLQDQLIGDLENRVKPHVHFPFTFSVLKGRDNYLCLTRLFNQFVETFDSAGVRNVPFEEKLSLLYLIRFAGETSDGDLQNTSYWLQIRFPILRYLKDRMRAEREVCNSGACDYHQQCFYPRARALAQTSDLVVINHSLLLLKTDDFIESETQKLNLVIDEAHNLEDVATNAQTEEASRATIESLLARLLAPGTRLGAFVRARALLAATGRAAPTEHALGIVRQARRRTRELGGYVWKFLEKQNVKIHPQYGATYRLKSSPRRGGYFAWETIETALNDLIGELDRLYGVMQDIEKQLADLGDLRAAVGLRQEIESVRKRLIGTPDEPGQRWLLAQIPNVDYDPLKFVHWIELGIEKSDNKAEETEPKPEQITWSFNRAPVRVDEYLRARVYDNSRALLFTSATLTVADSMFGFFLDRLGLTDRIAPQDLIQLPREFDYEKQVLFAMPAYMKATARYDEVKRFQEEMGRELECLFRFTEGRGLVLHTARTRMEYVAQHLEKKLDNLPVYWQREGSSKKLLKEEFEEREESILLGLKSFWEGIDVPGPSLSYLVIEKLPFPTPSDPIIEARREDVRARGGQEWSDYLIPLATIQFKQGFGRLMRKKDDRGVVFFMDKKFRNDTFYREQVLQSLPGFKRDDAVKESEESREKLYHQVADHMRDYITGFDWDGQFDRLPCIREEALTDLERLLRELKLPLRIPEAEYAHYRDKIIAAAKGIFYGDTFQFREMQEEAIQSILAGNDTLVVLPTGSGKSFIFQITALLRDGVTIVFSPLIALMRDQVDKLKSKGLTLVDYIVSGQSGAHRDEVYRRMTRGELKLVYIAPERIRDYALAEALAQSQVTQIVVDEAHCVHMWGQSFRPDFLNIPNLFGLDRPPIVALTATASKETRDAIVDNLHLHDPKIITRSVDRPELKFIVYNARSSPDRIASQRDKLRILTKILHKAQENDEYAIVYTSTVREAENLTRILDLSGFSVRYYHGRMDPREREEVQELFREGIIKTIVATKAFGMGIDKSDVRYVVHYNIPGDIESYFQEAGRAGRDGKESYCVLLYHASDVRTQQFFIDKAFPAEDELDSLVQSLRKRIADGNRILVSPQELADDSGVDVERLDVGLHLLERMGYLKRSYNFTLNANLLLNRSPEWIKMQLDDAKAKILDALVSQFGASDKRGIQVDLMEVFRTIGASPIEVDRVLIEIATKGWAVYRPWERGYVFEALERLMRGDRPRLRDAEAGKLRARMERNLKKMIHFAERLGSGDCRRAYILEWFGEKLSAKQSHCCNLCNPDAVLPWRDVPAEDVADFTTRVDPSYLVLRAVEWNDSLRSGKFTSPYTQQTLAYILSGNTFPAVKKIQDPIAKMKRARRLEASPHFGILKGLHGGAEQIKRLLDHLQEQGYVEFVELGFNAKGGGEKTYRAPVLSAKGKKQIQEGKYLWL